MARHGENIYKRKDNRWEGRYKNGYKENGSVKYSSVYGKSYAEVKAALANKKISAVSECTVCKMTVNNLITNWLSDIRLTVKESTYQNYLFKLDKHIIPSLGGIGYEKLTAKEINGFAAGLIEKGLSAKYARDILSLLKSVFKYANKKYGYADKSNLITMPKDSDKHEKPLLNDEQQKQFIDGLSESPERSNVGLLLTYATGIRVGELCALTWADIDMDKRIIFIRHTVQRIACRNEKKATKVIVSDPKTSSSLREIPIPEFVIPFLEKIRADKDCYLLSGTRNIVEPRRMQYRFKAFLNKLNLPNVSFHALRHMFATNCLRLNFDIKTLSEILGHSSASVTLNRYVHSSMKRKFECMKIFSDSMK